LLALEQYLMIYLFSIYLINCRSVKTLCAFLTIDFILDSVLYSYIGFFVSEYLIIITLSEITLLFFTLQFVKDNILRNLFVLCYVPTLICPLFLLTIDHWIMRNDFISEILFLFCNDIGKYSNEVFLSYLLYKKNEKSLKGTYWQVFILANYVYALLR
jgi:hypothetical protein